MIIFFSNIISESYKVNSRVLLTINLYNIIELWCPKNVINKSVTYVYRIEKSFSYPEL